MNTFIRYGLAGLLCSVILPLMAVPGLDTAQAKRYVEAAQAQQGDRRSVNIVTLCYRYGKRGVEKDLALLAQMCTNGKH